MKKIFVFLAALCCLSSYSDSASAAQYPPGYMDAAYETQSGPCVCYCPYTYFKPVYYYTSRCVQEPFQCCRQCVRYVPREYEVMKCRYVPQYYTEKYCRMEPEMYCIEETRYRPKRVCDLNCRYVPCSYIKRTCSYPNTANECCPQAATAPPCCNDPCQSQSQGGWSGQYLYGLN